MPDITVTYSGTAITGTDKTPKKFSNLSNYYRGSRVYYQRGDQYVNSQTGHVYQCTQTAAQAKDTLWKYVSTNITKKPAKPATLSVTRGKNSGSNTIFTLKVKPNDDCFASTSNARRTTCQLTVVAHEVSNASNKGRSSYVITSKPITIGASSADYTFDLEKGTTSVTGVSLTKRATSYWPSTQARLDSLEFKVVATNPKGSTPSIVRYYLKTPIRPVVEEPSQDTSTGTVSCTGKVNGGLDEFDARRVTVTGQLSVTRGKRSTFYNPVVARGKTTATVTIDVPDRQTFGLSDYAAISFEAVAEGLRGKSTTVYAKDVYVSRPGVPVIRNVSSDSYGPTDVVRLNVSIPSTREHPTTNVRLDKLVSVDYERADDIPANAEWQPTDCVDNGNCTAMVIAVQDVIPDRGKRTWLRLKAWNYDEGNMSVYSVPVRVTALERDLPTAQDDDIEVIGYEMTGDGPEVEIGWDLSGDDDSTHTELSWSENRSAWKSTEQPETFMMEDAVWDEGGLSDYRSSCHVIIAGVEDKTIFVRARRVLVPEEGNPTYGPYSNVQRIVVGKPPDAQVSLAARDSYVTEDGGTTFSWSYDGIEAQRSWEVLTHTGSGAWAVIANGTGVTSTVYVPYKGGLDRGDGSVRVSVDPGTGTLQSNSVDVALATVPTLGMSVPDTVTGAGLSVALTCDVESEVGIVVRYGESSYVSPQGDSPVAGDVVWDWYGTPQWASGAATVQMPSETGLLDGTRYEVEAVAVSAQGLRSEEQRASFVVDLARKAPMPSEAIEVVGYESDGVIGAIVSLMAPEDYTEGDVYDVYRCSREGMTLIASDVPLDGTVDDTHAPFGDAYLRYRVVTRTPEGSLSWSDYDYELGAAGYVGRRRIRLDWDGGSVTIDGGVAESDSYAKSFERFAHMDGSVTGKWDRAVDMGGSLSGTMIRGLDVMQVEALTDLARHAGPCFVRTSDGSAYEADVSVGSMSTTPRSAGVQVSLKTTMLAASEQFTGDVL